MPRDDGERQSEIWALNDVSFEVKQGEIFGVIGRNGAGKSTLLKILSRITAPTSGRIECSGRLAALLEVGTGFHPELTGRENIYLNGSILGMQKSEIDRHFDAIVDFSGVEQFIDTPVKRYSSGMHVRLGFAVAAHLQNDILIVDEVLAVGDVAFQRKCVGRMRAVCQDGRTVIFVSHNMSAIHNLCDRAALFVGGRLSRVGTTDVVIDEYLRMSTGPLRAHSHLRAPPEMPVRFTSATLLDSHGDMLSQRIGHSDRVSLHLKVTVSEPTDALVVAFAIVNGADQTVAVFDVRDTAGEMQIRTPGEYAITADVPAHVLVPGMYSIVIKAIDMTSGNKDVVHDCLSFEVADFQNPRGLERAGFFIYPVTWNYTQIDGSPPATA